MAIPPSVNGSEGADDQASAASAPVPGPTEERPWERDPPRPPAGQDYLRLEEALGSEIPGDRMLCDEAVAVAVRDAGREQAVVRSHLEEV